MEAIALSAGVVFLAEFGDKSQLLALTMAARHRWRIVAVAVVVTAVVATSVSALAGGIVRAALPAGLLAVLAGLVFLGFAVVTAMDTDDAPPPPSSGTQRRTALSLIGGLLVAELGDKTMFATAGLAAELGPVVAWLGATVGMAAAGLFGVLVGARLGAFVPRRALRIAASCVFAAVGLSFLVSAW